MGYICKSSFSFPRHHLAQRPSSSRQDFQDPVPAIHQQDLVLSLCGPLPEPVLADFLFCFSCPQRHHSALSTFRCRLGRPGPVPVIQQQGPVLSLYGYLSGSALGDFLLCFFCLEHYVAPSSFCPGLDRPGPVLVIQPKDPVLCYFSGRAFASADCSAFLYPPLFSSVLQQRFVRTSAF
jgi:hypothetical protein